MALSAELREATILEGEFPHIALEAVTRIPREFAWKRDVLAYRILGSELHVIVPDEDDETLLARIADVSSMRVRARSAPVEWIRKCLPIAYPSNSPSFDYERDLGDTPPAVRAMDEIHESAIASEASDIHIEPAGCGGRVRIRVDGLLHETRSLSADLYAQIVSRVKLLSGMDIADKRRPQDGRYTLDIHEKAVDARVSSMPTVSGEKIVIRLLDLQAVIPSLDDLGMDSALRSRYRTALHAPHGFMVVSGPTGSGKTTTLYASIAERNVESQHVCTIEDPIEARIADVAQVQVESRGGVSFASALRSFLRQDPNVIMVGEMRDAETANVAISAALSGQLVVTSLHASDGLRSIDRLIELGIQRHAIAAALSGILAQRLVRRLCPHCRVRSVVAGAELRSIGMSASRHIYEPAGCDRCRQTGYRGRTGIFEFVSITGPLCAAIASGDASSIEAVVAQSGYVPMVRQGVALVEAGETSLSELRRVLPVGGPC